MCQDLAIFTKYTKKVFINLIVILREREEERKSYLPFTLKLLRGFTIHYYILISLYYLVILVP